MEISPATFDLVKQHLIDLDYHGPVALACDDSKLSSSWRLCWSEEDKCHLLIGGISGPIRVADEKAAQELIQRDEVEPATKVCPSLFQICNLLL